MMLNRFAIYALLCLLAIPAVFVFLPASRVTLSFILICLCLIFLFRAWRARRR